MKNINHKTDSMTTVLAKLVVNQREIVERLDTIEEKLDKKEDKSFVGRRRSPYDTGGKPL